MPEGYKIYTTLTDQSVYDICLNTYGNLDLLSKLMGDNGISSISRRLPAGTQVKYDAQLVNDQRFAEQGYTFATRAKVPGTLLLDLYPGAFIACSTRKLSSGYNGAACRVRRSLDDREQDIGFTDDNDLDVQTLLYFLSGSTGYVAIWYDQSGNNNHFTQSTGNSQPVIKPHLFNRYAVYSDGVNDFMHVTLPSAAVQPYTIAMISNIQGGSGERFFITGLDSFSTFLINIRAGGSTRVLTHAAFYAYTWPLNTNEIMTITRGNGIWSLHRNMVNVTPTMVLNNTSDVKRLRLFAEGNAALTSVINFGKCVTPEVVLWSKDYTTSVEAINNNMNKYFKIY